jgi:rfaE bifunctional protein nucleotidyltransferase chain/domain
LRQNWRAQHKTLVWTNGCFDLFHAGHLYSLQMAKALGDVLVVGVNSDRTARQLKGPDRPFAPAEQRAQIVAGLDCVDYVIIFDEATPAPLLARLQPDIQCKGGDYGGPKGKPMPEAAVVSAYGGKSVILPLFPGFSTSDLVQRIQGGQRGKEGRGAET